VRSSNPRDAIAELVDEGSFEEVFPAALPSPRGEEVLAGIARIDGKRVALYAQDPTSRQGLIGSTAAEKIVRCMRYAGEERVPIVALLASPGVDVQEGLRSGEAYTAVIAENIALSGRVPQLAAVMGVTMGAPAYSATLMDFVLFNKARSHLVVTGPTVVERMIGQETSLGELGGSAVHARTTGIAHFVDANPKAQLERLKWLVGFLPAHENALPDARAVEPPTVPLPEIPERMDKPFDITLFVAALVDGSRSVEYAAEFGRAIVTAFAHIEGHAVGIVANQSRHQAGAIDADAARKAARFIRLCDAYQIPIVTLIDVPGFMPGVREEHRGLLREGAGLCAAMRTRVARLSVVVRRCYGAAAFVMLQPRSHGGDLVLSLAGARIAAMGFDAAKHMVYPDDVEGADAAKLDKLRQDYERHYESAEAARQRKVVDEIVDARGVRARLGAELGRLRTKGLDRARNASILP
jgi:acetyl-CoA carboxylase carboxyltransferase component